MKLSRLVPPLSLIMVIALACSDDGAAPASDTPVSTAPANPSVAATATAPAPEATTTNPPEPANTPRAHPPGSTNPVTVAPVPAPPTGTSILTDVRVGAHPELGGWDRIVFEFEDSLPPGEIRYGPSVVRCGSGLPVNLNGGSILAVTFIMAQAHNEAGELTIDATEVDGPGFVILRSRQICDFEGQVSWAVSVISARQFTVVKLADPPRIVIDIKQ